MSWKKNGISYALWAVYLLAVGLAAVCTGIHTGVILGLELPASAFAAGAFLVSALLLFFGIRRVAAVSARRAAGGAGKSAGRAVKSIGGAVKSGAAEGPGRPIVLRLAAAEGLAAVLLVSAGLVIRVLWRSYAGEDADYFSAACVAQGQAVPQVAHGAEFFYLQLLHVTFLIFGNKWMAGIWLQAVLQLLAGIILYFGVRRLAGIPAAIVMLAFWNLAPQTVLAGLTYSPHMLYFCVYGLGLLCIASFLEKCSSNRVWTVYDCLLLLFAGAAAGFVIYLDITGITLLLLAAGALWLHRPARRNVWENGVLELGTAALGAAAGFAGCIALDAFASGKTFWSVLTAWRELYAVKAYDNMFWLDSGKLWVYVILIGLLLLGIGGFWCRKGGEKLSPWMPVVIALCWMGYGHITASGMNSRLLLFWVLTVLAGIGVSECFHKEEAAVPAERPLAPTDGGRKRIPAGKGEDGGRKRIPAGKAGDGGSAELQPSAASEEARRPVKLIENPLPLPKKHVKKTMDYKITPKEDQFDFDLEVPEDDDFDL